MTEKSWDSTKGAISRPLTGSNSISVAHTYDGFGNRTSTTDAKSVQTKYTLDGSSLYVTKVENAFGTAVKRTAEFVNDFSSGLVTESKDTDNNVRTLTTYDVFGRPTLVQEAYATAIERRTSTEYSDTARRVIVRSDLNAMGDGKLVTINHYDQLGRVRLTRKLEDAATQSAYDETHGVKVQTRHAFSNPNSYDIVSSPYRANTSALATSEPGMGWKRMKYDKGGRTIEIETFIGAALPSPWASNTVSSGKVTTEYDAEHTKVTDQAGKVRRSRVDALGRLVRVDEPDGGGNLGTVTSPAQPTNYTYNALGNLTQTSQTGAPNGGGSSITQTRTFNYSSLGRLTSAVNPESGTIIYQYDANGNLTKKTDARGIYIDYTYDELNRNKTLDYSNTAISTRHHAHLRQYDGGRIREREAWKDYAGVTGDEFERKRAPGVRAPG
ncbi:MAG: RHS repeat protein [Blastocatellales bacterium]|nr:RHS repeat protein [Blastocatellales bacterium]